MAVKNASPFLFRYTPYLSQGYNNKRAASIAQLVVVPYYLSQGYNKNKRVALYIRVVVPYYLSQGYNA